MKDCAVVMPREGCCTRCKGCWYNGTDHASHTEWADDGRVLRCEAGVITISKPECYSPCEKPKHQRHTHYNCPVCDGESSNFLLIETLSRVNGYVSNFKKSASGLKKFQH